LLPFAIGPPGDRLGQATHEPRQITEARPQNFNSLKIASQHLGPRLGVLILAGVQAAPARRDFVGRPTGGNLWHHLDHDMEMIAHDRISPHGDSEDPGEFAYPVLDPLPPVLVGTAALEILAAEPGAAHAA
jgi:hypothetical protein